MLYHGSNTYIKRKLIPNKSFHYQPYVYATANLSYALVRAGKFDVNEFLLKEDYDGNIYTLIELSEGAIEKVFDTDGYVYVIKEDTFSHTNDCMPNEFISTEPCDIVDTLYIGNILNNIELHHYYYKIIRYGSEEEKEYWKTVRGGRDGYLQRRKERIERLNRSENKDLKLV